MLSILYTLDYEIHGNGDGSANELIVEPTERLLRLFDQFGAKLTIMADVAEILKFKEYRDRTGRDDYAFDAISNQLRSAIRTGHDVQLHLHSSYFNSHHEGGKWVQDWTEYNFAGLPLERMSSMVRAGKAFLEDLLKPVDPAYACIAFRAANWSVSPSDNVIRALLENGITIDTSVFKHGRRDGLVTFDYSNAYSHIYPWRTAPDDVCARDDRGQLWEFPIYTERRCIGSFVTPNRIYRALSGSRHKIEGLPEGGRPSLTAPKRKRPEGRLATLFKRHAWKADFNQCTGRQLISALRRAEHHTAERARELIPFVLIGHSKLITQQNERSLRPLLEFVRQHSDRFEAGRFRDFLPKMGPASEEPRQPIGQTSRPSVLLG